MDEKSRTQIQRGEGGGVRGKGGSGKQQVKDCSKLSTDLIKMETFLFVLLMGTEGE